MLWLVPLEYIQAGIYGRLFLSWLAYQSRPRGINIEPIVKSLSVTKPKGLYQKCSRLPRLVRGADSGVRKRIDIAHRMS